MNTKTLYIIIGALILVILVGAGFYVGNYIQNQAYQQGVNDGMIFVNNRILNDLVTNGFVTFIWVDNNQTQKVDLVPYRE